MNRLKTNKMYKLLFFIIAAALTLNLLSGAILRVSAQDNSYADNPIMDQAYGGGAENETPTIIKIFHTNDIHGRASNASGTIGFAQFKTFINSEAADGKLVLDAGDTFHGQTFATLERGASIAELMKAVGYDAIAAGNHDFNYGWERLLELEEIADTPVLSANTKKDGKEIFRSYIIREIEGIKFGIFGLTSPETSYKTNPKNVEGIDFGTDEEIIEISKSMVQAMQNEGAAIIIALTHIGDDDTTTLKSTDIAQRVPGLDIIIDGHSHSNYMQGNIVNNVMIASVGEHFKNVGMITLAYNKSTGAKNIQAKSITAAELPLDQYPEDLQVKGIYDGIMARQAPLKNTVIGSTPVVLNGVRDYVRAGETNLGRLITNAMLYETGAEIAITNGGGIRASISQGDITKGQVLDVLPFGNYIVTKYLTGAQVKAALEHGMTFGAGSFPHFAGMEVYVFKDTVQSGSTTVEKGYVTSILVNGQPICDTKTYLVATNDFMAAGGTAILY
jgi:5'-nucleotidase / UDP-sugar diphosphatase